MPVWPVAWGMENSETGKSLITASDDNVERARLAFSTGKAAGAAEARLTDYLHLSNLIIRVFAFEGFKLSVRKLLL